MALVFSVMFGVALNAQTPPASPDQAAPPKKANARPAAAPTPPPAEPYDRADAKTMGTKCVQLNTEAGVIEVEMFPDVAPESVRNFLNLTALGAFDNTTFSRVVPGFVVQGGNLWTNENITNAMKWRSKKTLPDEPGKILHDRGILSMARPAEPNRASTHFFILLKEASNLNPTFAAFGRVISGIEVVEAINKMPVFDEKPEKPVRIKKATIFNCPVPVSGE